MRVRIRFSKTGEMKFIGHLDVMRYFQKAIRRAGLPAAYSGGFSPHMIMSFASPLGVGITSSAEYFDLDMTQLLPGDEILNRLNAQMADGISVTGVRQISEDKHAKGMTLVAAAEYTIPLAEMNLPEGSLQKFLDQQEIPVEKETKKGIRKTDIRPLIYTIEEDGDRLKFFIAQGSQNNLSPKLLLNEMCRFFNIEAGRFSIHRNEIFARTEEGSFIPLLELGSVIE